MYISSLTRKASAVFTGLVLSLTLDPAGLSAQQTGQTPAPASIAQGAPGLPLAMEQAVAMALDVNLGLKADRLNVDVAAHSIAVAKSAFLPRVQAAANRRSSKFEPQDFTQGSTDLSSTNNSVSGTVGQSLPWYGGNYSLTWAANRLTSAGGFAPTFNPNFGSSLRVDFSQPLLRGLKLDTLRVGVETAERRRAITDLQLQERILATESNVRFVYLNLVAAIEGLKVSEQNMEIAQQSLRQSKARVAVGQSPQIEIIQAEAQVAFNQERLILAAADIETQEDNLRSLILDPARPDFWTVKLTPTDQIRLTERTIDVNAAIKNALANRLDLQSARRDLEITDLNLKLGRDNTLPNIDLNLSYTAQGTGGTQFAYGDGFPPPIVSRTDRSFGSALGDVFGGAYPTWNLGVVVTYPIGRTAEQASHAQAQVQRRQQDLSLQELELLIVRDVREAGRQVQNSFQRVTATRTAREASEEQLRAEERRFQVGFSTTLELQVRQRELANARVSELNAMIAYNRALIDFDRVQKTR